VSITALHRLVPHYLSELHLYAPACTVLSVCQFLKYQVDHSVKASKLSNSVLLSLRTSYCIALMSLIIVMLHTEYTETGSQEPDRAVACVVLS